MQTSPLDRRIARINDLICAAAVLLRDSRTMMPSGGTGVRGQQIATLTRLARDMLCADETMEALARAEAGALTDAVSERTRSIVDATRRAIDHHRRVPGDLVARRAALQPLANAAWVRARAENDFSIFARCSVIRLPRPANMRRRSAGGSIPAIR